MKQPSQQGKSEVNLMDFFQCIAKITLSLASVIRYEVCTKLFPMHRLAKELRIFGGTLLCLQKYWSSLLPESESLPVSSEASSPYFRNGME